MEPSLIKRQAQNIDINEAHDGQRLDNFLINKLKNVPRSKAYKLIRTGQVRVNSKRAKPHLKLNFGDRVRIPPFTTTADEKPKASKGLLEHLKQRIVYEDDDILILNKPSGVAVHGGSGVSLGVIEAIRQLRPNQPFLELVHRLDRETSGCLLIAKTRKMLVYLHALLRDGKITKIYQALVRGEWQGPKKVVMPLSKNHLKSGERVVKVDPQGKEATTLFKSLATYEGATLVQASPVTGRTHQIRVHAAYMGNPIAGDEKYGDRKDNDNFKKIGLKRLFLHAYSITIPMEDKQAINIVCELDQDLLDIVKQLNKI